jgi:phosphopantetheine adenylyltransferase
MHQLRIYQLRMRKLKNLIVKAKSQLKKHQKIKIKRLKNQLKKHQQIKMKNLIVKAKNQLKRHQQINMIRVKNQIMKDQVQLRIFLLRMMMEKSQIKKV